MSPCRAGRRIHTGDVLRLAQDALHVACGDQLDRADAAQRAAARGRHRERSCGIVIRRLCDEQKVVFAEREIQYVDLASDSVRRLLDRGSTVTRIGDELRPRLCLVSAKERVFRHRSHLLVFYLRAAGPC